MEPLLQVFLPGLGGVCGGAHGVEGVLAPLRVPVVPGDELLDAGGEQHAADVLTLPVGGEELHSLREPAGLAGVQVHRDPLLVLVQPPGSGDVEGEAPGCAEEAALQVVVDNVVGAVLAAGHQTAAAAGTGAGLVAVPLLVLQVEVQTGQPGGIVRVGGHRQPGVGGVHHQLPEEEPLAVHLHPLVQGDGLPRDGEAVVQLQVEGEGGHHLRLPGRFRLVPDAGVGGDGGAVPVLLPGGHRAGEAQGLRYLEVIGVVDVEVTQIAGSGLAADDGVALQLLSVGAGDAGVDVVAVVVPAGDGVEEVDLHGVQDQVFQPEGDAVFRLFPVHHLDKVVLHRRLQAGGEGHRRRQVPEAGDAPAGLGEGDAAVHQQHEGRRHAPQGGRRDAQPPLEGPLPGPGPGPLHRALQLRRRIAQLGHQGPIFLVSVHEWTASSPSVSSSRSSRRAFRCRVTTVPWGMSRVRAVSARVRPVK